MGVQYAPLLKSKRKFRLNAISIAQERLLHA